MKIFVRIVKIYIMSIIVNQIVHIKIVHVKIITKILSGMVVGLIMISKETFVNTMERLETLDKNIDAIDAAFKKLSPDFCGFYITEPFDIVVDLLKESFKDKHDLLGYFVYELDYLHKFHMGCVTQDDKPIDLSTWDKVYDHMVNIMEEDD